MANLPIQRVTVDGIDPAFDPASSGGDTARPGGVLEIRNGDTADHDVTLALPGSLVTGDPKPDKTYTVAAGEGLRVPLLDAYRDPSDHLVHISYPTGVTSLEVAVVTH